MKKLLPLIVLAVLLGISCAPSPEEMAEKYMRQLCKTQSLYDALELTEKPQEIEKIQADIERQNEKLERLNQKILEKYHGDEEAMTRIQKVAETYQCEEK